jgi:hypothetical protein
MRRRLRILLAAATIFSALLLVTTLVLWVRSYGRYDAFTYTKPWQHVLLGSNTGRIQCWIVRPGPADYGWQHSVGPNFVWGGEWPGQTPTTAQRMGFWYVHPGPANFLLRLPHALLALVFGALPAVFLIRHGRRRTRAARLAIDRCSSCGYDLRATSYRCPECGNVPQKA